MLKRHFITIPDNLLTTSSLSIFIKGVEDVICDVIKRHCINIEAVAILQFVSN